MRNGGLNSMTRRDVLRSAGVAAAAAGLGPLAVAGQDKTGTDKSKAFPEKFLWGCATAGYQVEGNNINTDLWLMEHVPKTIF